MPRNTTYRTTRTTHVEREDNDQPNNGTFELIPLNGKNGLVIVDACVPKKVASVMKQIYDAMTG